MKTVWDLLNSFKKNEYLGIHNTPLMIREVYFGENYEITDVGIKQYFESELQTEFEIISIKEKNEAFHVVLRIKDLDSGNSAIGCSIEDFKEDKEKSFSKAVNRALLNSMRALLTPEKKVALIGKYMKSGNYIRIPKETEKVRLFKSKANLTFANQAG